MPALESLLARAAGPEPEPPAAPTATALLDAAERLFAEEGLHAVSTRRIVLASGQGNLSAAHYHFGSRDALIRAVLERRLRTIDAIRHRRLDALVAGGRDRDVAAIVEVSVGSVAEVVESMPWGADYVRVLAQALFDTRMRLLVTIDPASMSSVERARAMARPLLAALTDAEFDARVTLLRHDTAFAVARWIGEHGRVTAANRRAFRATIARLTAFMAGGLLAPPSRPRRGARPAG